MSSRVPSRPLDFPTTKVTNTSPWRLHDSDALFEVGYSKSVWRPFGAPRIFGDVPDAFCANVADVCQVFALNRST